MNKTMNKTMAGMLVGVAVLGSLTGCGSASDTTAAADTASETQADYKTYEFDTYEGDHVVLDAASITAQETVDDPYSSDLVPADAETIAPGRDFEYLQDADNYYVLDFADSMVTVASKAKATVTKTEVAEEATDETADTGTLVEGTDGVLDMATYTVSYEPDKFYGYYMSDDPDTGYVNYTGECAGTSIITISKSDCDTVDAAIEDLGAMYTLKTPSDVTVGSYTGKCTCEDIPTDAEGIVIDNVFSVIEANGSIYVINQSVTRDPDADRAQTVADEMLDVVNSFTAK